MACLSDSASQEHAPRSQHGLITEACCAGADQGRHGVRGAPGARGAGQEDAQARRRDCAHHRRPRRLRHHQGAPGRPDRPLQEPFCCKPLEGVLLYWHACRLLLALHPCIEPDFILPLTLVRMLGWQLNTCRLLKFEPILVFAFQKGHRPVLDLVEICTFDQKHVPDFRVEWLISRLTRIQGENAACLDLY